jgi:agmatine/peptidylarginine deiminase
MGAGETGLAASPSPARLPVPRCGVICALAGRFVCISYWNCALFPLKNRESSPIRVWLVIALVLATGASVSGLFQYYRHFQEAEPAEMDLAGIFVVDAEREFPEIKPIYGTLPGEFEQHEAIMIAWPFAPPLDAPPHVLKFQNHANQALFDLISNSPPTLRIIVAVPSTEFQETSRLQLEKANIPLEGVEFTVTEIYSRWIRDFAPFSMRQPEAVWVAGQFFLSEERRRRDAKMPRDFAAQWNINLVEAPFYIDGGNLVTNGDGLVITTTRTLEVNRELGYQRRDVNRLLRQYFGAKQIVYLEPLAEEATQHVDMFLTIPTPDTVVLGEYTKAQDPVNHSILERNRQRLLEVQRKEGPLNIVRVPMPPHGTDFFGGTYTNVVYANGVLFVPRYADVDDVGHARAVEIYRQLLPEWKIISTDASAWIMLEGALHCLTKKFYRMPPQDFNRPGV